MKLILRGIYEAGFTAMNRKAEAILSETSLERFDKPTQVKT
jgi:hypothetical protein